LFKPNTEDVSVESTTIMAEHLFSVTSLIHCKAVLQWIKVVTKYVYF